MSADLTYSLAQDPNVLLNKSYRSSSRSRSPSPEGSPRSSTSNGQGHVSIKLKPKNSDGYAPLNENLEAEEAKVRSIATMWMSRIVREEYAVILREPEVVEEIRSRSVHDKFYFYPHVKNKEIRLSSTLVNVFQQNSFSWTRYSGYTKAQLRKIRNIFAQSAIKAFYKEAKRQDLHLSYSLSIEKKGGFFRKGPDALTIHIKPKCCCFCW
jgi:hypothetical protein